METCTVANQYCHKPANLDPPERCRTECFACGQAACTAPGCSTRSEYLNYNGKKRLCHNCLEQRYGDHPTTTKALIKLYQEWVRESGYDDDPTTGHVARMMEPHRKVLAERIAHEKSRTEGPVQVGQFLYGHCGGRFAGFTRSDEAVKRVVGIGRGWAVVQAEHSEPQYYRGDLALLVPYRMPTSGRGVIETSLGAMQLTQIDGKSGLFWRGTDEDGSPIEVFPIGL